MRVSKTLVDLKRVGEDAFCMAGAGILCHPMSCLRPRHAKIVEGLQNLTSTNHDLEVSFRLAGAGLRMTRLTFIMAGAVLLTHGPRNRPFVLEY